MRINQLKSGAILSYITQAASILISIFYTPVMIRILGQSEHGLLQMVSSIVSYLSLLNMGFSSGYIRFYSRYKKKDENEKISILNGMFLTIFTVIAGICLICGVIMIVNVKFIFGNGFTFDELNKAKILMSIMIFNMVVSFITNVFSCYITAHERFFLPKISALITTVLGPFLTFPLLMMGYGSVGMVTVTAIFSLVSAGINIWYCLSKLNFKIILQKFDFSLFKEMWVFTFFIFINMIVDQINWNVDRFLIGRLVGIAQVSVYSIAAHLNTLFMTFSGIVSTVFVPKVNFLAEKSDSNKELTNVFTRVGRIQFIIVTLILSGYLLFGKTFISLWLGQLYTNAYLMGAVLMFSTYIPLLQNLGIEIQRAKNLHHFRSYLYIAMAIINVFISIEMIKMYGSFGAVIGTAISLIVCNTIIMNVYYHKKIGLNILLFWKEMFKFIPAMIIITICGYVIKVFMLKQTIISLVVCIMIYCIVYCFVMWFIGVNKSERKLILKPLKVLGGKIWKK